MSRYNIATSGVTPYNVTRDTNINDPLKKITEGFGGNVTSVTEDTWNPALRLMDGVLSYATLIEDGGSTANVYIFKMQTRDVLFSSPDLKNGMRFYGYTDFPNTLTTATVNIGGTGAKNIKKQDATTDVEIGDIQDFIVLEYNQSNDVYLLVKSYNLSNIVKQNYLPQSATIASGSVAYAGRDMILDTEASASTDDLDTITGANEGDELRISITDDARNVVIKHATGANNFRTRYGYDVNLDLTWESITFRYNGTLWEEVARSIRQPSFSAYLSSNQSIATSTVTTGAFDTEEFDLTSDYDTTTYRFTPSVAGLYLINASVTFKDLSSSTDAFTYVRKNGTRVRGRAAQSTSGTFSPSPGTSVLVFLNGSTDYVDTDLFHNHGSSRSAEAQFSAFSGFLTTN